MNKSSGYFKGLNCPFYLSALCERPYCHFRHVAPHEKEAILLKLATAEQNNSAKSLQNDYPTVVRDVDDMGEKLLAQDCDHEPMLRQKRSPVKKSSYLPTPISQLKGGGQVAIDGKQHRRKHEAYGLSHGLKVATNALQYRPTPINKLKAMRLNSAETGLNRFSNKYMPTGVSDMEYDPEFNYTTNPRKRPRRSNIVKPSKNGPDETGTDEIEAKFSDDNDDDEIDAKCPKFTNEIEAEFSDEDATDSKNSSIVSVTDDKDTSSELAKGFYGSEVQGNEVDKEMEIALTTQEEIEKASVYHRIAAEKSETTEKSEKSEKSSSEDDAKITDDDSAKVTEDDKLVAGQNSKSTNSVKSVKDKSNNVFDIFNNTVANTTTTESFTEESDNVQTVSDEVESKERVGSSETSNETAKKSSSVNESETPVKPDKNKKTDRSKSLKDKKTESSNDIQSTSSSEKSDHETKDKPSDKKRKSSKDSDSVSSKSSQSVTHKTTSKLKDKTNLDASKSTKTKEIDSNISNKNSTDKLPETSRVQCDINVDQSSDNSVTESSSKPNDIKNHEVKRQKSSDNSKGSSVKSSRTSRDKSIDKITNNDHSRQSVEGKKHSSARSDALTKGEKTKEISTKHHRHSRDKSSDKSESESRKSDGNSQEKSKDVQSPAKSDKHSRKSDRHSQDKSKPDMTDSTLTNTSERTVQDKCVDKSKTSNTKSDATSTKVEDSNSKDKTSSSKTSSSHRSTKSDKNTSQDNKNESTTNSSSHSKQHDRKSHSKKCDSTDSKHDKHMADSKCDDAGSKSHDSALKSEISLDSHARDGNDLKHHKQRHDSKRDSSDSKRHSTDSKHASNDSNSHKQDGDVKRDRADSKSRTQNNSDPKRHKHDNSDSKSHKHESSDLKHHEHDSNDSKHHKHNSSDSKSHKCASSDSKNHKTDRANSNHQKHDSSDSKSRHQHHSGDSKLNKHNSHSKHHRPDHKTDSKHSSRSRTTSKSKPTTSTPNPTPENPPVTSFDTLFGDDSDDCFVDDSGVGNEEDENVMSHFDDLPDFMYDDEETIEQCRRIFNETRPGGSSRQSTDTSTKSETAQHSSQQIKKSEEVKKRIAHVSAEPKHEKMILERPHASLTPAQVMHNRFLHMQQQAQKNVHVIKNSQTDKIRTALAAKRSSAASGLSDRTNNGTALVVGSASKFEKRVAHVTAQPTPAAPALPRPNVPIEFGSKVPANIRQRYLNLMIDECLKIGLPEQEAYDKGQAEEQSVYTRSTNRNVYLNRAVNAIKRLRTQTQTSSTATHNPTTSTYNSSLFTLSHNDVLGGARAARVNYTVKRGGTKNAQPDSFHGVDLYKRLQRYILTEEQLKENNFPRSDPDNPGLVKLYGDRKSNNKGNDKICLRCGKMFVVFPNCKYAMREECIYHWGKPWKKKIAGSWESRFNCCDSELDATGCQVSKLHVHNTNLNEHLVGFMTTLETSASSDGNYGVYAMDCEMVYTFAGIELARVTVVNSECKPVYESLVKPDKKVIDYNTKFSGITGKDLDGVTTTLRDVQAVLLSLFKDKTIVVGHSLESDLLAVKMIHSTVVDTSLMFPHRLGLPYKRALRNLMSDILMKIIQSDEGGHDSQEDAAACIQLLQWKLKEDIKNGVASPHR